METRTVLVVEDEYVIGEHLRSILLGLGYAVRAVVGSVAEALPHLRQAPLPDLVLLDVMLSGELDGIDLAHRLRALHEVPFVFVTSLTDAATLARAKHTRPHGYVVKPFTEQSVYAALEMAFARHAPDPGADAPPALPPAPDPAPPPDPPAPDSLFVRERGQLTRVRFEDVLWLQADGNYTSVHTRLAKHTVLSSLKELELRLPPARFIRVHKSYLVALSGIAAVDTQGVLVGEQRIPVGRAYQPELGRRLNLLGLL
ncbi:LytTR family transcriptional regulator DNA-binding domain-containing protein [Hymenobacter sp.]|uniref:LytR/AlgR family response regulator transcription factor n=1 Tax=Hymenobacter sp. TaxID=1898978 RepID=UPI00286C6A74|nr:LytTR family transcriptional regulator DNA-binding domain-containing protein [Hymenobacter sp.]